MTFPMFAYISGRMVREDNITEKDRNNPFFRWENPLCAEPPPDGHLDLRLYESSEHAPKPLFKVRKP